MERFIDDIRHKRHELQQAGITTVDSHRMAKQLLAGLHLDYRPLISSIGQTEDFLNFEDVAQRVLNEYRVLQSYGNNKRSNNNNKNDDRYRAQTDGPSLARSENYDNRYRAQIAFATSR